VRVSLLAKVQRGRTPRPPRLLVYGTPGIGKAQPLTAKVLTPTRFVEEVVRPDFRKP
jgi:Cdc6-like AAA superfamily ATPase